MEYSGRTFRMLLVIASALTFGALSASLGRADDCAPYFTGLDSSFAQASESSIALGKAMGETFLATDLLIESITVWRPGNPDPEGEGWHLFILGTDSLGAPDVGNVILDGPTVYSSGLSAAKYVPLVFQFNPPITLPHPGTYEAAFLGVPCSGTILLAINLANAYGGGEFWLHDRSAFSGCSVRPNPMGVPSWDMVIQIESCAAPTPTVDTTWGTLKAKYR